MLFPKSFSAPATDSAASFGSAARQHFKQPQKPGELKQVEVRVIEQEKNGGCIFSIRLND